MLNLLGALFRPASFAIDLGLGQDPTHDRDVGLVSYEFWLKPYASTNTARDLDRWCFGILREDGISAPFGREVIRIDTGIPMTPKKMFVGKVNQSLSLDGIETTPWALRVALGMKQVLALTYGLETTVSDVSPGKDNADVVSLGTLYKGAPLVIPVNGVNQFVRVKELPASGLNLIWAPTLEIAPADGATVKEIRTAELALCTGNPPNWSGWLIQVDQNLRKLAKWMKKLRFAPAGDPLVFGDQNAPVITKLVGKSLGYGKTYGGRTYHVVCEDFLSEPGKGPAV